ncbi:MAG: PASTA domain-containing protein [Bacteroidetes bacterium]|nr:PASTA domain-containing protein [Bacteroidota bacterium]
MKMKIRNIALWASVLLVVIVAAIYSFNNYLMPYYVEAPKLQVPNVVGMNKVDAARILQEFNLNPIEVGPRFDSRYREGEVFFQKPSAGMDVKERRRVYIHISGGEPLVKMPKLINKTVRDAKVTLERLGLHLGRLREIKSELPLNTIIDQEFVEGTNLDRGDSVSLHVSIGPRVGMIRVPNILGKSEKEADKILRGNNLKIGERTYIISPTVLPNTIIDQYPSYGSLLNIGDSIEVVIAKSKLLEN